MNLPYPAYVVFGEALTDMIFKHHRQWIAVPGGSCWNVARVAARLGLATGYAGAISLDVFGDDLFSESVAAGLDHRFLQRYDAPPLLAIVASSEPPSYFFIGEKSADQLFDPAQLPKGWRESAQILHFGGISLAREPLASRLLEEAQAAHDAGRRIAYDPNFRVPMNSPHYQAVFRAISTIADYIKVSAEDLVGLFPGTDEEQALRLLKELAPSAEILLTRGAQGMSLFLATERIDETALRVDVVDTVGCGDAAMGGWIAGKLLHPLAQPLEHVRLAIASAACTAMRAGPYAGSTEEVALQLHALRQH